MKLILALMVCFIGGCVTLEIPTKYGQITLAADRDGLRLHYSQPLE